MCKECFFFSFEEEIHQTITDGGLFHPGDKVAIGASGGKDSTVLAYVLNLLNGRHGYGLHLQLLSIDEGITGYRDDSLETVKLNQQEYGLPLKIISYEELYGWTMDAIVKEIGLKNNCTFCGVFRRQALDRGALLLGCNRIATGHNADDIAETIIMNILRGDIARLQRCTAITTGMEGALPRCKPFKYTYEKEIVMYAYFKRLTYFSTECIYSPNAYRGHTRTFIKDAEKIRSTAIIDIIHSGESLAIKKEVKMPVLGVCTRCGYVSSQRLCKACLLLEGLNSGLPKLGIGKTDKIRRIAQKSHASSSRECKDPITTSLPLDTCLVQPIRTLLSSETSLKEPMRTLLLSDGLGGPIKTLISSDHPNHVAPTSEYCVASENTPLPSDSTSSLNRNIPSVTYSTSSLNNQLDTATNYSVNNCTAND